MEKDLTVNQLIALLEQLPNKDLPIDVQMEGCYGEKPRRYYLSAKLIEHKSDIHRRVGAISIEFERGPKYAIETDLIDNYVPLSVDDCQDLFGNKNMTEKDKKLIVKAINHERKSKQKFANINKMKEDKNA